MTDSEKRGALLKLAEDARSDLTVAEWQMLNTVAADYSEELDEPATVEWMSNRKGWEYKSVLGSYDYIGSLVSFVAEDDGSYFGLFFDGAEVTENPTRRQIIAAETMCGG